MKMRNARHASLVVSSPPAKDPPNHQRRPDHTTPAEHIPVLAIERRLAFLPTEQRHLHQFEARAVGVRRAGQIRLAHAYKELLEQHDIAVAQILLTLGDTEQRRRYLNARGTLNTLLSLGAVPVINENDTVATAEIRYGDNDRLAARVAQMAGADCLVLLSDIDAQQP